MAWPHSQQKHWPQGHATRLQPPFFSTALAHLGHGFVLALSQLVVSLSSSHLARHRRSMSHVLGACGGQPHAKQNACPHAQRGSHTAPRCTCTALPQCGTEGHHFTRALSSM